MLHTVRDLLIHGTPVRITITPEPGTHGDVYQLQWQDIEYDPETETWHPVTDTPETSLKARLRAQLQEIFTWTHSIVQYAMPTFDVDRDQINVFEVNNIYLFKQYFDNDDVFDQLKEYYNSDAYRFELPTDNDLNRAEQILEDYFYELNHVDDIEPYCVVKEKYSEHRDILRNAVVKYERGQHNIFLMKDQLSVDQALEQGAVPLEETEMVVNF